MVKILTLVFAFLFSISFISALTIYSGDSIELELEKPYDYYSIVGNSTPINLTVEQNGNNVTITPDKYSQQDSFEIIFFDKETEIITVTSGGGGGGGSSTRWRTEYVDRNVTTYVDKEVVVPGEIVSIDKEINSTPGWVWVLIIVLVVVILYMVVRGFKKDEQEEISYTSDVATWN